MDLKLSEVKRLFVRTITAKGELDSATLAKILVSRLLLLAEKASRRTEQKPPIGRRLELNGKRFGRLVVLGTPELRRYSHKNWVYVWGCLCDCGAMVRVFASNLTTGHTVSCGCLEKDLPNKLTNGRFRNRKPCAEYTTWISMRQRCESMDPRIYSCYRGKGIKVCPRWNNSFRNFLADMGPRPSADHSIDRIDGNGNYEPGNCRWATLEIQANNKASNVNISINGISKSAAQWSRVSGICSYTILGRIRRGWEPREAVWKKPGTVTRWNCGSVRRKNS
jgi:hypothetical protein